MLLDDNLALSAIRLIFTNDEIVSELGFRQTGPEEWKCWSDTYEFCVRHIRYGPALIARVKNTGVMSMVCLLRMATNYYGKPILLLKRKLEPYELRSLPDYII